jgi:hypothetical protein
MRLIGPELSVHRDVARLSANLERRSGGTQTLWYEFDATLAAPALTNRLDGFAVAALLIALESGEPELLIEGAVSERLLYHLQRQFLPILRIAMRGAKPVCIRAACVDSLGQPAGRCVATGYSGGIDSFYTIAQHSGPEAPPGYRLTHLLFLNVGSHGRGAGGRAIFKDRWNLVKDAGAALGLQILRVDSNLDDFLETRFEQLLLPRVASAVLCLQGLFSKFLLSSSHQLRDVFIGETPDLTYADPATVHLFSTESLEIVPVGGDVSRVEKTRRVVTLPAARQFLNVCINPLPGGHNCSRCVKCLRTLATLDLLGELDGFGRVFDLDAYRRFSRRGQYLLLLRGRSDDRYIKEIYDLTRQPGVRLPAHVSAFHAVWPVVGFPWRAARGVKRWVAAR